MSYTENLLVSLAVVFHCSSIPASMPLAKSLHLASVCGREKALHCFFGDVGADVFFVVAVAALQRGLLLLERLRVEGLRLRNNIF